MITLRRTHRKTKRLYDPRYPIHGFKIVGRGSATNTTTGRGSFMALKPGEKGKNGAVGE